MDRTDGEEWNQREEGGPDEAEYPTHLPAPWETDDYLLEDRDTPRRHDAFSPARKKAFLKALSKTGCILDACRETKVSSRTVYYHQGKDYDFLKHCTLAIDMAGTTAELMAWERGVTGVPQEMVRGGKVVTVVKRSDSILRLLLQGSNPKKYGPRAGFTRKRILKEERKQIEREVRTEISASMTASTEEMCAALAKRLKAFSARSRAEEAERLADGWIKSAEGHLIPPGWVRIETPGGDSGEGGAAAGGACENSDSV